MERRRRWRTSHAAWRAACLPICHGHREGDGGDDKDNDDNGDDDDSGDDDDNDDNDNESHMSSTVYLVEASWVGGTILRWHKKSNRHVGNMIYDKFTEDLPSDLRELLREINHKVEFGHMYRIVTRPGAWHKIYDIYAINHACAL